MEENEAKGSENEDEDDDGDEEEQVIVVHEPIPIQNSQPWEKPTQKRASDTTMTTADGHLDYDKMEATLSEVKHMYI